VFEFFIRREPRVLRLMQLQRDVGVFGGIFGGAFDGDLLKADAAPSQPS